MKIIRIVTALALSLFAHMAMAQVGAPFVGGGLVVGTSPITGTSYLKAQAAATAASAVTPVQ